MKSERVKLVLDTGDLALTPGQTAQITEKARRGFSLERFHVAGNAKEWIVHELRINKNVVWKGRHVGYVADPINARGIALSGVAVKRGDDVVIVVSYCGRRRTGWPFHGVVVGGPLSRRKTA
jgi:hypothetical protein